MSEDSSSDQQPLVQAPIAPDARSHDEKKIELTKKLKFWTNPAVVLVSLVVIFFLSQLLAGIVAYVIADSVGVEAEGVEDWLTNNVLAQLVTIFLIQIFYVGFVFTMLEIVKLDKKVIGFTRKPKISDALWAVLGYVAFFAFITAALAALGAYFPEINSDEKQDLGFETVSTTISLLIGFVSLAILPPFGEEILVRGYTQSFLRMRMPFLAALLVTSIVFGAAHLQLGNGEAPLWSAGVMIGGLSLFLGFLREKTGAIWAPIMLHFINNAIASMAYFYAVMK